MSQTIYVAIHNEARQVISGAKGQSAFLSLASLGRSIGQTGLPSIARATGVKTKDLYTVIEIDMTQYINEYLPKGSASSDA